MPDVEPVPERLHTVTPRLVCKGADEAIDCYVQAFGAEEVGPRHRMPDGGIVHAEIRIGDSIVYVTDEDDVQYGAAPPTVGDRVTTVLAINVPNVDEVWERAVGAGCEVVFPLADQFYGDRGGRVRDPFGHQWMLSTHIEDVSEEELERRMQAWSEENG